MCSRVININVNTDCVYYTVLNETYNTEACSKTTKATPTRLKQQINHTGLMAP